MKIGLQLYTMRDAGDKNLIHTIERVAKIGYDGVEFAGYAGIPASEMKKVLDDNGLVAVGSHLGIDAFNEENFVATTEYLLEIGAKYATIPGLAGELHADRASTVATAEKMEYMARKCEAIGIKLSYHNHTSEFTEIYEGDCVEDLFVKNSEALGIELDVGWATAAGVIVPKYMEELGDRLHLLHIKDVTAEHEPVEICTGTTDFPNIFAQAKKMDIEWGVVEQDRMNKYEDAFESVAVSLANIKKIL